MNDKQKSWRALGLLALAMTAGAIRLGDAPEDAVFAAASPVDSVDARCDARLDPTWFEDCLDPEAVYIASR